MTPLQSITIVYSTMDQQDQHISHTHKKQTTGFAQYSFIYELYKAILVSGFKMPTPVQRKVIPVVMTGRDVIVCYKTGSGKTLSYILPMINNLKCHSKIVGVRGLILIPTRQLAEQITHVLKQFIKFTDLKYTLLLGGHTYEGQFESLSTNPDIIIATPGRLMQLLQETDLKLGRVQMVVYDEADQLFENGSFYEQLKEISKKCPNSQRLLFSATITENLNDFAKSGLKDYSYINQQIALPEQMTIDAFVIRPQDKPSALVFLLEKFVKQNKIIIFTSTRFHVDFLVALLSSIFTKQGQCEGIYGKMDMDQRVSAMDNFRKKKGRSILVVTDVAARGIDIPSVQYVIHYDYPTNHKTFIHRSGRTARKDEDGHIIALISHNELPFISELAQTVGRKLVSTSETKETINIGSLPIDMMDSYTSALKKIKDRHEEIQKMQDVANKAFQKFKSCRSEVSQNHIKKAKTLSFSTHFKFKSENDDEEEQFIEKIKNFTPKKSFLELQKIMANENAETDNFLSAVQKIRNDQTTRKNDQLKKEKLREQNSKRWKQILNKQELKELENYKQKSGRERMPIMGNIEGVEIELPTNKQKKSQKKSFKDPRFFIETRKDPNVKTEFDSLPKIKNNELDNNYGDENPHAKKKERVWDKQKNNYVWKKDKEDVGTKEQKGKKAYLKWKKKTKLSLPKVGQQQNAEHINQARESWVKRRMHRHGWRENQEESGAGVGKRNLKNNKTKAIEKKYKKRLISKSQKSSKPNKKISKKKH